MISLCFVYLLLTFFVSAKHHKFRGNAIQQILQVVCIFDTLFSQAICGRLKDNRRE